VIGGVWKSEHFQTDENVSEVGTNLNVDASSKNDLDFGNITISGGDHDNIVNNEDNVVINDNFGTSSTKKGNNSGGSDFVIFEKDVKIGGIHAGGNATIEVTVKRNGCAHSNGYKNRSGNGGKQ